MRLKKIATILLSVAMIFSAVTVPVAAEGEKVTFALDTNVETVYEGATFTLDLTVVPVQEITTMFGCQIDFSYDPAVIQPVDAEGNLVKDVASYNTNAKKADAFVTSTPTNDDGFIKSNPNINLADGVISYTKAADFQNEIMTVDAPTAAAPVFSFRFKAVATGDMDIEITAFKFMSNKTTTDATKDSASINNTPDTFTVVEMPSEPSVSELGFDTDEPRHNGTITATYTFDDGASGTSDDAERDDSEVKWYVEGTEASIYTGKTLSISNAEWVGKTLSYTVAAKVQDTARPNYAATGEPTASAESAVVAPADGYAPEATVTLAEETLAAVNVVYSIKLDEVTNAFAVAEDETTVAWYIAEEAVADVAGLEGLEVASSDAAYAPSIEDLNKYVVLVVTPSINVDGTSYPGDAVVTSALITAEYPEIDTTDIDVNATLKVKKTVSASGVVFVDNMPAGAEGIQEEEIIYKWFALAEGEECTEETMVGEDAELLLTDDMKDKFIVLAIDYTNELGLSAETAFVKFVNAVKKASTKAPAVKDTPTLGSSGTVVTPPTEEPGEEPGTEPGEQPGDEPTVEPNEDPSGNAIANGAAAFTDVDKEAYAWAYEGIDTLAKAGVIKGMTETTFGPELTATNAQMIALAVRIAGLTAENATTEKVDAEHWVADEAAVADAKGILGVYGDKVEVEEAVSREVAFTLLYNALKAAGVELPEVAEAIEFTDAASIDANCVEAIDALVKAGIVDGMGDGTLAPKATLTRAQLAKILGLADTLMTK